MKRFAAAILAGVAMSLTLASVAQAKDKVIGVSWSNFQEERWKTDEAAIEDGDRGRRRQVHLRRRAVQSRPSSLPTSRA